MAIEKEHVSLPLSKNPWLPEQDLETDHSTTGKSLSIPGLGFFIWIIRVGVSFQP